MTKYYSPFTPKVITMQCIENYADDKSKDYWKFKGNETFVVYNTRSMADATALITEAFSHNKRGYKMFPVKWECLDDFLVDLGLEDVIYRDYFLETVRCISKDDVVSNHKKGSIYGQKFTAEGTAYYEIDVDSTDIKRKLNASIKEAEDAI